MLETSRKPALIGPERESALVALLGKRGITKDDVAALRSGELGFGLRSRAEAEHMFAIERQRGDKCRAWGDFLVECVTDFVVWDQRPAGVLTEDMALWLADQVGEMPSPACLALLVSVMEEARVVPAWFMPAVRVRASKLFASQKRTALRSAA